MFIHIESLYDFALSRAQFPQDTSHYTASAESGGELQKVFTDLPTYLIVKHDVTEISFAFTAIGALFATLAVALSMLWNPIS